MTQQGREHFDVVLIGMGLASTACGRSLADGGARVAIVPGVARSRSPEADGGLVNASLLVKAFGPGAPLGQCVSKSEVFSVGKGSNALGIASAIDMPERRTFRRVDLEGWVLVRATDAGATYLDGFIEGTFLPAQDGSMTITAEGGARQVTARHVVLCEGADPRIAMRIGLRPDYTPDDQIHFARTILAQAAPSAAYRSGIWRTSWGMPVDVSVLPLESGVMVSVAARIENVMRCSRSSVDALDDLLASPVAIEMGLTGSRVQNGVELVALRPSSTPATLVHDRLLMSIDSAGVVDPRKIGRFDAALQGGLELASWLANVSGESSWDDIAMPIVNQVRSQARYHDDRRTGYLEEGPDGTRLVQPFRRLRRGIVGRLRAGG